MRPIVVVVGITALAVALVTAFAEQGLDPAQMAVKFSKAQKQNMLALMQYSWKSRAEVQKDGETKSVKLNLVRFDASGKPQMTPIGGDQEEPKGGIRGKIQEKMEEKGKEMATEIAELVKDYTFASADTMANFFEKAIFASGPDGTVEVKGNDFLMPGDSVDIWMDASTEQPRKFEFKSTLEGDPVEGTVTYQTLPSGVYYPAQTVVTLPSKNLRATIENFDYVRQGG